MNSTVFVFNTKPRCRKTNLNARKISNGKKFPEEKIPARKIPEVKILRILLRGNNRKKIPQTNNIMFEQFEFKFLKKTDDFNLLVVIY